MKGPWFGLREAAMAFIGILLLGVVGGCKEDDPVGRTRLVAKDMPTLLTRNVETLISDSGITRFRMKAPTWYIYEEVEAPYWRFPDGLYLEKFNPLFQKEATVTADSAHYFKNEQLWRLDGNVNISNTMGERFLTNQLYWSQRDHTVYSDSFIHIERRDRTLEGYGFNSNEQMTRYTIRQVQGIFPASAFKK